MIAILMTESLIVSCNNEKNERQVTIILYLYAKLQFIFYICM